MIYSEGEARARMVARRFTVDGEGPVAGAAFFPADPDERLSPEDLSAVAGLLVHEECMVGGGAFATFQIRRVA